MYTYIYLYLCIFTLSTPTIRPVAFWMGTAMQLFRSLSLHVCIFLYLFLYISLYILIDIYIHPYMYIYIHTHLYIYIYIYICIHLEHADDAATGVLDGDGDAVVQVEHQPRVR